MSIYNRRSFELGNPCLLLLLEAVTVATTPRVGKTSCKVIDRGAGLYFKIDARSAISSQQTVHLISGKHYYVYVLILIILCSILTP